MRWRHPGMRFEHSEKRMSGTHSSAVTYGSRDATIAKQRNGSRVSQALTRLLARDDAAAAPAGPGDRALPLDCSPWRTH